MTASLSPSVPPLSHSAETQRILLAVKTHEMDMFLPAFNTENRDFYPHLLRHEDLEFMTPETWTSILREFRPTILVSCWNTPPLPREWIADADCPLRYVCHLGGTIRSLVPRPFLQSGGLVTNWGGLAGETVAEHALLLALSALRRQPAWPRIITGPAPSPYVSPMLRLQTRTLRRRRVGLHGFGHVARALVELLKPFDVKLHAFSEGVPPALIHAAGVTPRASLRDLAEHSEIFFECEALTPRSIGSVNADIIGRLPAGAVFVNVARGALVDEAALLQAARDERLVPALDVMNEDPVNPSSPFLALPDAVLSPHIAGPTFDLFPECGRLALENLTRYLAGEPPIARVTIELYDRST